MQIQTQIGALQLSQLSQRIADTIAGAFQFESLWVIADVSNHTFYPNKDHHYFELVEKDANGGGIVAKVAAVAWRIGAARIRVFEATSSQRFKSGMRVCVKVQVEYHPVYGLKLIVLDVDASYTIGQLELQRQATISRLLNECAPFIQKVGERFLTTNNMLTHSPVIQRLAVISSSASAGYQDFMHTLVHNQYGYRFQVNSYFTTVQGEASAEGACRKIQEICASEIPFDAVVIIRGGGADTDFLLFDEFILCEAVAKLHIPVITGLGHLKNQMLVDFMAHTSVKTPTKAAEFIIAHNQQFEQSLLTEQQRIIIKSQQVLSRYSQQILSLNAVISRQGRAMLIAKKVASEKLKEKVVRLSKKLLYERKVILNEASNKALYKPQFYLLRERGDLNTYAKSLKLAAHNLLTGQMRAVAHYQAMCRMMSPVNLLKKGFALVYYEDKIITEGSSLKEGALIKVRMADSEVQATIQQKQDTNGDTFDL